MEKHQAEIKLKFKGIFKIRVRFSFEWQAWFLAWNVFKVDPDEFGKLDPDKQFSAIAYGAAAWYLMNRAKPVYFTFDNMVEALMKASKEDNQKIAVALRYAQWPEWVKSKIEDNDKKKVSP